MGKKKTRTGYSGSKKIHSSVSRALATATRAARTMDERMVLLTRSWKKGDNPWLTIPNPNVKEGGKTNMPFIRIRANDHWGKPGARWSMKSAPEVTA